MRRPAIWLEEDRGSRARTAKVAAIGAEGAFFATYRTPTVIHEAGIFAPERHSPAINQSLSGRVRLGRRRSWRDSRKRTLGTSTSARRPDSPGTDVQACAGQLSRPCLACRPGGKPSSARARRRNAVIPSAPRLCAGYQSKGPERRAQSDCNSRRWLLGAGGSPA